MNEGDGGERERKRLTFERAADLYDARPGYPDEMYDVLERVCGLGSASRVLEVGPGTGQATVGLLALGCHVTAVELGAQLAERLRTRTAGRDVEIVVSPFETVALEEPPFDCVFAATSFHWIEPVIGIVKAAALLGVDGWLALAWNVFGDPERPDPFQDELYPLLKRIAPEVADPGPAVLNSAEPTPWTDDVAATELFEDVHIETIQWTGTHTTAEVRALFSTFSPWIALPDDRRDDVLDQLADLADSRFDGVVSRPYRTRMVLAEKRR